MKKKLVNSFILAFFVSFVTILYVYPQTAGLFTTNISEVPSFNSIFFMKVFATLLWQTWALWLIFYNLAKKLF